MKKIVVLGATGYAGGLVLEALIRRGVRPVLAGSSEEKLAALSAAHGDLEYQVADATELDSVRALVDAGGVLVTTVGPFNSLGLTVARAAAEQGAHYVDSTGEVGFVRTLRERHDAQARSAGAVMLPAFGNDYVPGFLAAGLAMRDGGQEVRRLDVGYFVDGSLRGGRGMSQGTRKTAIEGMTLPSLEYRSGNLVERRTAETTRLFPVRDGSKRAILASGTEVLFLPGDFPQLESVSVYNGWMPRGSRIMPGVSRLLNAVSSTEIGSRIISAAASRLVGPPGGPDAVEREKTAARAVAVATDAGGRVLAEAQVRGPSPYDLTGELIAWAARELAQGNPAHPGVVGPIEAFGLDGLIAACDGLGLRRG
ncbi:saccharopine dehydrogenase family protein [Corynebacterium sp. UBA2622]|uniref:saccharopine dehydrogenase family protein n=1 Tax=Corynebacterium sp. UBA2622 TaxID=1946393 RepID=UPI0025BEB999|nr:saccharopine dehydrogenase NADP-binding domain-containing protein [Corynebacterium sp. UBA2622]